MRGALRFIICGLVAAGCGPIEYVNTVTFQASRACAEAKKVHADELAPYEYTHGVEYLHKARELAGEARWKEAVDYGRHSGEMARRAHEMASEKGQRPHEARTE